MTTEQAMRRNRALDDLDRADRLIAAARALLEADELTIATTTLRGAATALICAADHADGTT